MDFTNWEIPFICSWLKWREEIELPEATVRDQQELLRVWQKIVGSAY